MATVVGRRTWLTPLDAGALLASACATAWLVATGAEWTEYLAFVSGVVCVALVVRNHIANWPVGIANSIFLFAVFWDAHLFADMWLQVVYVGTGLGGWWMWVRHRGRRVERPTTSTGAPGLVVAGLAAAGGWGFMYWYFARYTSAAAPVWDSLLTSGSLVAQVLLMRRTIESWLFWIAVDVGYVALFWSRELWLTSALYVVFTGLAVSGHRHWRADL